MSEVFIFVREERCCCTASKGIIFGFWEGEVAVVVVEWSEEGPICSFSWSMRPPLWQESDRIVKLAPFGMRSTTCRKSISVKGGS